MAIKAKDDMLRKKTENIQKTVNFKTVGKRFKVEGEQAKFLSSNSSNRDRGSMVSRADSSQVKAQHQQMQQTISD